LVVNRRIDRRHVARFMDINTVSLDLLRTFFIQFDVNLGFRHFESIIHRFFLFCRIVCVLIFRWTWRKTHNFSMFVVVNTTWITFG